MSTIVVVKKNGKIVIGADTLTSFGSTKFKADYAKNQTKICQVGNSYIGVCGNAVVELMLMDFFKKRKDKPKLNSVDNIFEIYCEFHKKLKDYYLIKTSTNDDSYESTGMDCLIANETGIYGVDSYRYAEEYSKFASNGSGFKFALGAMKVLYDSGLTAYEIAEKGLEAASEYDGHTDKPFDIIEIEYKEVKKE